MIPYQGGKTCFIRLSYNFDQELLLRFGDQSNMSEVTITTDEMFLIYASSGNPLNIIDYYVKDNIFTTRICKKDPIDKWGMEHIEKIMGSWGFDHEIFTMLLNTPISLSSLTIGDYAKNYNKVYKDLWGIQNYNFECFDELLGFKDHFINHDLSDSGFQKALIQQVTDFLEMNLTTYFLKGQSKKVKDIEGDNPNFYDDLVENVKKVIQNFNKKMIYLFEDPTTRNKILKGRKESLEKFNELILPILEGKLFVPLTLYKITYSDRGINKGYPLWSFNEPGENKNSDKLMNQLVMKSNFFTSISTIDKDLTEQSKTEFNVVLQETFSKIREEYEKWLQTKFKGDRYPIIKSVDLFDDFISVDRDIYNNLTFTNNNIVQKMERYINQYLSKFHEQDYLTMKSYYKDGSLNFTKMTKLFYEMRGDDYLTLPVTVGDLFEIR
jgi:hypothetical protein